MAAKYIHDEWCRSKPAFGREKCDCYVQLLKDKDKRIAELEAKLERMRERLEEAYTPKPSEENE